MSIEFSIIICTLNRDESLKKTLDSLLRLRIPDGLAHEILVIDNGSSDETRRTVETYIKKEPDTFKYFFEENEGLSNARNCGVENSRGDILAFIDDDEVVDDGWILALHNTFSKQKEAIAVQGKVLLQGAVDGLPQWLAPDDLCAIPYHNPRPAPLHSDILLGANMAIRREAFRKYGLFDKGLGIGATGAYEESEFCERLREGNERVLYQPDAIVFHEYHSQRLSRSYLLEKQRQLGHSMAYIDAVLKSNRVGWFSCRRKLTVYFLKYLLHAITGNRSKQFKYRKRIRFHRSYISRIAELQTSDGLD